ncbi:MAG TPA: prephenate dehydrogenase [Firmicutes bacterium]|nr:prephenate dehydrogenase [Bacillota bacterium]
MEHPFTAAVVGLGLIGGSMAKALSHFTSGRVIGYDWDTQVLEQALASGAIQKIGAPEDLGSCDLVLLALYPQDSVAFVQSHVGYLMENAVVVDLCGVKSVVCGPLFPLAREHGFFFVGGHPMAGKEVSGFSHSDERLFTGASMLLVPDDSTPPELLSDLDRLFRALGFEKVVHTTPENHDQMIAYTSQLAHVVSSAYIKSPTSRKHQGYSAGSFRDLTRVAKLNETMWSELFLENREPLLEEIDTILSHLREYRDAIAANDRETLTRLLREGREIKERVHP